MRTKIDERLRLEVERYRLLYTCGDCVHFDDVARACSQGFPAEAHLDPRLEGEELLFCKLFEAG